MSESTDLFLVGLIPGFDATPEWQEAVLGPHYASWCDSPVSMERVRGAVATRLIDKVRTEEVRRLIISGDPFWLPVALNVVAVHYNGHHSGRIQLSALRALQQRYLNLADSSTERPKLLCVLEEVLLKVVDQGGGREFKAHTKISHAVASPDFKKKLEYRARYAPTSSIRFNAQRMLDVVNGKPYRPYMSHRFIAPQP